jgi:O-antigen ligase
VRPRRAAVLGLALAAALAELALAHALSGPGLGRPLALVGAVLALAVVFTYPIAGAAGLLVVTASIFYSSYFTWSVGPVQIHLEEVVFAALALVALVAPRRQTWGGAPGVALGAFLALVVVASWVGVQAGRVSVRDAFDWARPLAFYASFWLTLRLFPDVRSMRRLLLIGLACGALTGVLSIVLQFSPSLASHFQGSGGQEIYTQAVQAGLGGLKRIREPGLACSYVLFWWALFAAMSARGGRRALLSALIALSAINLALSFNRNMWLGLLFGLAITLGYAGVRIRHRLLTSIAVAVTAVALTFTLVGSRSSVQLDPILARATTVLTPSQVGEESSLRDRARETSQAWQTIKQHPVFGVGPGADFGVRFNHEDSTGLWVNTVQLFLHDQWLWLMLIGGVPAMLAFLTFLGLVLSKAWGRRSRTLSQLALGTGIAMVMLSAFVMPYLGLHEFALMLGIVAAVIVRSHELQRGAARGIHP